MLPELGQIALILALLVAALQALLPLAGAHRNKAAWMEVARPAAYAQLWLVMLAFIALTVAFVQQDFSVKYVADKMGKAHQKHDVQAAPAGAPN